MRIVLSGKMYENLKRIQREYGLVKITETLRLVLAVGLERLNAEKGVSKIVAEESQSNSHRGDYSAHPDGCFMQRR